MAQLIAEQSLFHVGNGSDDLFFLQSMQNDLLPVLNHNWLVSHRYIAHRLVLVPPRSWLRKTGLQLVVRSVYNTLVLVCSGESLLIRLQQFRGRHKRLHIHPRLTVFLQSKGL